MIDVTVVWLLGTVVGLARVVAGVFWATRITRRAVPVTDWAWSLAAMRVAESMGVARPALRASSHATVPLTWGLWGCSVIVLPLEAESWPADRRHAVLLHEMAHVRRHDCLVRSLARVACASSLGAIGNPSAIDPLTSTMLNDASPDVRRQAARSLGLIAAGG